MRIAQVIAGRGRIHVDVGGGAGQVLTVVEVGAPAVNCVFNPTCTITVTDSLGYVPLPYLTTSQDRVAAIAHLYRCRRHAWRGQDRLRVSPQPDGGRRHRRMPRRPRA